MLIQLMLLKLIEVFCKENAVILILCRNSDLDGILESLNTFEKTFNQTYEYPYVFLNDENFTDEFKNRIQEKLKQVEFGKLNPEEWDMPNWIDKKKSEEGMKKLESEGIIYGGSLSYRNMCRFFSGYFYKHPLTLKYDYYWRIEPGVKFFCKMNYDPFEFLRENNKEYGFVISLREWMQTIPTLWNSTYEFILLNRDIISNTNQLAFLFENNEFNGCHFWSNFEIASFKFFRSKVYEKYFEFLDKKGGFYYERWGDAPVHTLAAGLFLGSEKIHFFDDIGYEHPPFRHCPSSPSRQVECDCKPSESIDRSTFSCLKAYVSETQFDK